MYSKKMYDVIIVGAGPAGLACSIVLESSGKHCLVIERKHCIGGKVCGDGLTSRCIKSLEHIGVGSEELLKIGGKKILYNITFFDQIMYKNKFVKNDNCRDFSIGLSRDRFDQLLYEKAKALNVEFVFETAVTKIEEQENGVLINGIYRASAYINAGGVLGISGGSRFDLPVGISARVIGEGKLKDECFYFFRYSEYADGYAWIFPVGNNVWNIGCWGKENKKNIKLLYKEFEKKVFDKYLYFESYDREPRGALLGTGDLATAGNCIGDAACLVDSYSGEGISLAIESGINMARQILGQEPIVFPIRSVVALSKDGMDEYLFEKELE